MYTHAGAGWSIRPLSGKDSDACFAIFRTCLAAMPWRSARNGQVIALHRSLRQSRAFVAEEGCAGVIGFLTLQAPQSYVDHLFVHVDWRYCGVARGLLDVASDVSGGTLSLDVDEENTGARRAYEALGWKVVASTDAPGKMRQMRLVSP